jgi:hypothetical protein
MKEIGCLYRKIMKQKAILDSKILHIKSKSRNFASSKCRKYVKETFNRNFIDNNSNNYGTE